MMNNLLVEIGLALQRQICERAGDVVASVGLSGHRQPRPSPPPPNEGPVAAAPALSPPRSRVLPSLPIISSPACPSAKIPLHVGGLGKFRGRCDYPSSPQILPARTRRSGNCALSPFPSPARRRRDPGARACPRDPAHRYIYICLY